jgi:ABC-type uncharacterized transport system permease subunit
MGLLAGSAASANPGDGQQLLYLSTWPHQILVFDAVQERIVDHINLKTDVSQLLALSPDKKTLYASTVRDNSIVVIDIASRKFFPRFRWTREIAVRACWASLQTLPANTSIPWARP